MKSEAKSTRPKKETNPISPFCFFFFFFFFFFSLSAQRERVSAKIVVGTSGQLYSKQNRIFARSDGHTNLGFDRIER
jgi:hypothetical protein